jgi:phosphate transport system substrate-binding protein
MPGSGQVHGKLVISGSSTMAPLLKDIGDHFFALHPGVRVEVNAGGSAKGLSDVRKGISDIGMFGRAMEEEDERDLTGFPIARDGVSLIVHRDNPVAVLSDEQIRKIFSGSIRNWSEVGGRNAPVMVVNRSEGRSQFDLFARHFKLKAEEIRAQQTIGDNGPCIEAVSGDLDAISYLSVGDAERRAKEGIPIKLLPIGGVSATIQNVRKGSFPISRPLTLITVEHAPPLVMKFIDFSLSSQVTEIVRQHNFVPYLD